MTSLTMLVLTAAKVGLLLGAAALATLLLRRASARLRSLIWTTAICGSLALPFLAVLGPSLQLALPLPLAIAPPPAPIGAAVMAPEPFAAARHRQPPASAPEPVAPALPWPALAVGLWLAGAAAVLCRQAVGWVRAAAAVRRGRAVEDPDWVDALARARQRTGCRRRVGLLTGPDLAVPATLGLLTPVIVLPEHGLRALAGRRDAVLLHEVVHVARGDWALRTLARVAVAVHWFNPLAWWAVRRLELEQELACDETVLALGEPAVDYASHLLAVARLAGRRHMCPVPVAGMARRHDVEERIMAILERRRIRPANRITLAAAVLAIAAAVPIVAAVQPEARRAGTELTRAILDLRAAEARLEPYHQRIEEAAAAVDLEAAELAAADLVDEEALATIERELAPHLERIAAIEIDMAPIHEQIEAVSRSIEELDLDLDLDEVALGDLGRHIEEQLQPHLEQLRHLELDLEPMHDQLERMQRDLEPLHERLAAAHAQMAPDPEAIARMRERLEPMQRALESVHEEMEPLHRELEATARRVERALAAEIAVELRERLGAVTAPDAPWSSAADRIVDRCSLHLEDDVVRLSASRSALRTILVDVFAPHQVGSDDAFTAAVDEAAGAISGFEVTVP